LPPEPSADTVLTVLLAGEVGDTPGAALIESNMLNVSNCLEPHQLARSPSID
jgi:hypothetical protein